MNSQMLRKFHPSCVLRRVHIDQDSSVREQKVACIINVNKSNIASIYKLL